MNDRTRTAGFGAEVKRRIMLGTYALSAGYYDAYYGKAQQVRTLIIRDFAAAYEQFDLLLSPTSPTTAFRARRQDRRPADHVPQRRVHDPVEPVGPAGHVGAVRHRRRRPARSASRCWPRRSASRPCSGPPPSSRRPPAIERPTTDRPGGRPVIGLEVHCELATATKLFCGCPNQFGDEPNTNVCPVCLGLPGSLPVLNEQAVELAMPPRPGARLRRRAQRLRPEELLLSGHAEGLPGHPVRPADQRRRRARPADGKRVGIERAHLEEDTGKSTHVGGGGRIHDAEYSLDRLQPGRRAAARDRRASPTSASAEEARAYVTELRAILLAVGASDAKMEEGSMRVDANVSVRRPRRRRSAPGARSRTSTRCARSAGPSSTRSRRQIDLLEAGEADRAGDPPLGRGGRPHPPGSVARRRPTTTATSRSPTSCRWCPSRRGSTGCAAACPPCRPPAGPRLADGGRRRGHRRRRGPARAARPRRPRARRHRAPAPTPAGCSPTSSTTSRPRRRRRFDPAALAGVVALEGERKLTATQAKKVLRGRSPSGAARPTRRPSPPSSGFEAMDTGELEALVDEAIAANADAWAKVLDGNDKAAGAITGHVMKATKGKADGKAVAEILAARKAAGRLTRIRPSAPWRAQSRRPWAIEVRGIERGRARGAHARVCFAAFGEPRHARGASSDELMLAETDRHRRPPSTAVSSSARPAPTRST